MISRNSIKTAIIIALQPLHVNDGGTVKDIGEYNPEVIEDIKKLLPRCPAVYVSYAGGTGAGENRNIKKDQLFSVFVLYKSLRSTENSEKGAITLMEQVEAILENNMLGLDIAPLSPAGDSFKDEAEGITMYALNYSTGQVYSKEYTV